MQKYYANYFHMECDEYTHISCIIMYTYMYSEHLVLPTLLKGNWRKLISMNFFLRSAVKVKYR